MAGRTHAEVTECPLTEAVTVYEKLKAGEITGRAVLVPSRGTARQSRPASVNDRSVS